jgi:PAS domain S-box-containing protein
MITGAEIGTTQAVKTILVVEDERVVARDIQRNLSDLGYSVPATAATAEQAILLASERRPDLVLMDIQIKGNRDGIETASILRKLYDVPIVYLTAYADEPTIARAKQTEPFGYLLKPVKTNELRSAVEIALFKHDVEKQLRERARWLATMMQSLGDAIISTDASGNINYMNPVAERLTGWRAEDAQGRSSDEVLHLVDDSRDPIANPLRLVLTEARTVSVEAVLVCSDGERRIISDSTAPIIDEGGAVLGAVMVFRDVSDRRQLQRQLEVSERLATVGTMAAGIAHEVNNPLAFVLANIGVAREDLRRHRVAPSGADDLRWMDEIESGLADAEEGASRIAKIVRDLMIFTRRELDPEERVNLNEVLDWSLEVVGHEVRPRGRIVRQFGDTPKVDAPSIRLGQVFVNLLINAAHALDPGKRETNEIVVTTRTDERGHAVAEIRDNGCGMTPELMEKAFEPFVTTKPVGQGTGLGLSVCHGIVLSLGGTIAFESEPGSGTLARVVFPAARLGSAELPRVERPIVAGPRGYLMVIDDEVMVRGSIRRVLGREHTITCPHTPKAALALFDAGMRFDLILCNLSMPEVSGMDIHEEIMRRDPEQARRMVFVSGGAFTARMVEFLHSVPNRRIDKPYEPRNLRLLVSELLAEMGTIAKRETTVLGDVLQDVVPPVEPSDRG